MAHGTCRYCHSMAPFTSRYPDRETGIALLLLRFSGASIAFAVLTGQVPFPLFPDLAMSLAFAIPLLLIAGCATRPVALLLAAVIAIGIYAGRAEPDILALGHTGLCAALTLLGPGAYSIDARIFGRRVIRLDSRSPDRGSER